MALDWFNDKIIQVPITHGLDYSDDDLDRMQAELERRRPRQHQTRLTQPARTDRRRQLDQVEAADRLANARNTLDVRKNVAPGTYQYWLMTLSAKRDVLTASHLAGDKAAGRELRALPSIYERWPGYPSST